MVRTKFVPIVPVVKPEPQQERKSPRKTQPKLDENYVYSDHDHQEEEGSDPSPEMSDGNTTTSPQVQKERKISETKSDDVIVEEDNNLTPSPKKEKTKGVAKKSTGGYPKQRKLDSPVQVVDVDSKSDSKDDELENTDQGKTTEGKPAPKVIQLDDEDDQKSITSKVSSAQSFTTRSGRAVKQTVYKDGDDNESDNEDSGSKRRRSFAATHDILNSKSIRHRNRKPLKINFKRQRRERSSSSDKPYSTKAVKDVKRRVLSRPASVKNGYKEKNSDESESNRSKDSEEDSDSDGRPRKNKKAQKETKPPPRRTGRNIKRKSLNENSSDSGSDSTNDDDDDKDYKKEKKPKLTPTPTSSRVPVQPEKIQKEKDEPKVHKEVSVRLSRTLPAVPLMKISTASSPFKSHPSGSKSDDQNPHIKTIYEDEEYIDLKKLQLTKQIELTDHEIYLKKLEAFKRENELGIGNSVYTSELKDQ